VSQFGLYLSAIRKRPCSWQDVEPTWDPLDEEGEEDEIYDAVRSRCHLSIYLEAS
jgi:hypothetical protein